MIRVAADPVGHIHRARAARNPRRRLRELWTIRRGETREHDARGAPLEEHSPEQGYTSDLAQRVFLDVSGSGAERRRGARSTSLAYQFIPLSGSEGDLRQHGPVSRATLGSPRRTRGPRRCVGMTWRIVPERRSRADIPLSLWPDCSGVVRRQATQDQTSPCSHY